MKHKLCIWIVGGSGVGKTTLARSLHKYFQELYCEGLYKSTVFGWGHRDREFLYTRFSPYSANLGDLTGGACAGTDTLSTKERIFKSYDSAIKANPIVIVEGIMATSTWFEHFKKSNVSMFIIHLEISEEENFKRLCVRRAAKKGLKAGEVILSTKTKDNLSSKLRNFRSLYRKLSIQSDYHIQIHSEVLSIQKTSEVVIQYMIDKIFH